MAIDRLTSASSLLAALRAEISKRTERSPRSDRLHDDAVLNGTRPPDPAALRRDLSSIVADVPLEDEASLRDAHRRVVRAVLLWEFGAELREHADWQPILDELSATLAGDESHWAAFRELVKGLQGRVAASS